jgi:hypothetical protein
MKHPTQIEATWRSPRMAGQLRANAVSITCCALIFLAVRKTRLSRVTRQDRQPDIQPGILSADRLTDPVTQRHERAQFAQRRTFLVSSRSHCLRFCRVPRRLFEFWLVWPLLRDQARLAHGKRFRRALSQLRNSINSNDLHHFKQTGFSAQLFFKNLFVGLRPEAIFGDG